MTDDFSKFAPATPSSTPPENDFSKFAPAQVAPQTTEPPDKVGAAAKGALGGLIEMGPTVAGAVAGGSIGMMGGPAAWLTVPAGVVAGGAAGLLAGQEIREHTTGSVEEMPPQDRPYGVAGETFGGSLPFIAAPLGLAASGFRFGASKVGQFFNRILDTAKNHPWIFGGVETSGATASAISGGVSESYLPGNRGARVAAEVAGGLLDPTRRIVVLSKGAIDATRRVMQGFGREAKETQAAKILQEAIAESGEDPAVLAAILREPNITGVDVTSAQKTGSRALATLERELRRESAKFGGEAERRANDAMDSIEAMIQLLRGTGDPQALRQAAQLRARQFTTMLDTKVALAEREAIEAASRITNDTPAARAAISEQARTALDEALTQARSIERELWERIPKDAPGDAGAIQSRIDALRAQMLPNEKLPEVIEGFDTFLRDAGGQTTSGDLIRFRSRMLTIAREADAAGNRGESRMMGLLAEAALDDLAAIGTGRGVGARSGAFDTARAFSRSLHDVFTRTFVGRATGVTKTGADRIPPELLMKRAFATGKEVGALQLEELEEATRFLSQTDAPTRQVIDLGHVNLMMDAQERILRLAASEMVDATTGHVSIPKLNKFIRDNQALLDRFPGIGEDLRRAVSSEQGLLDVRHLAEGATRQASRQSGFAQLIKVENPVDAIEGAFRGNRPMRDIASMARVARRAGPDAVEGMKASVIDYLLKAGFSPDDINSRMFDPIRRGQPSMADVLRKTGIFNDDQLGQMRHLLDMAGNVEDAMKSGLPMEAFKNIPPAMRDLIARIAGIQVGGVAHKAMQKVFGSGVSGGGLVAAGAGSRYVRAIMNRIPVADLRTVLIDAALDPDFAARLLTTPPNEAAGLKLAMGIHAYLLRSGISLLEPEEPGE